MSTHPLSEVRCPFTLCWSEDVPSPFVSVNLDCPCFSANKYHSGDLRCYLAQHVFLAVLLALYSVIDCLSLEVVNKGCPVE